MEHNLSGVLGQILKDGTSNLDKTLERVTLDGDLNQMGIMTERLGNMGFNVGNQGVYPVLQGTKEEIKAGLQYLFDRRVAGWWGQEKALIEYGVCTKEVYLDCLLKSPNDPE